MADGIQENPVADLLVELGCEELPPGTLEQLANSFYEGVCAGLSKAALSIDAGNGSVYYTPRRLGFILKDVPRRQEKQVQERRGPAVSAAFDEQGNPTQAALGFARSVNLDVGELDRMQSDKGEWLFCRVEKEGLALSELLFPILLQSLASLPVAKPMRWSDHEFAFVRPVHWLVVLHGKAVLEGEIFGLTAGRATLGHRIHAPGPHHIATPAEYEKVLAGAFVLVTPADRRNRIRQLSMSTVSEEEGTVRITDSLLDEVCNITEWPVAVKCQFDEEFLEVPKEALVASMEDHQKFFPVLDRNGHLTSGFVAIANLESRNEDEVREGFERVIRPRLADARFFWEQDKKISFEAYASVLQAVVFQKNLGTIGDKSKRIDTICTNLREFFEVSADDAHKAALLCKCDLATQMVGEFPELQGIMGGYYARESGESESVCKAIGEHYKPGFSGDDIPSGALGRMLSLADRLDTLVGIFAAGLRPSGNKDPYALRRGALGAVRILTEAHLGIELDKILKITAESLSGVVDVDQECMADIRQFILTRLRNHYLEAGYDTNVVNAVFAAPVSSLPDLKARLVALSGFMEQPVADRLVAANKRIGNILRKSEQKFSREIKEDRLIIAEEKSLFEEVTKLEDDFSVLIGRADYPSALSVLANLDESIAAFFDQVMVMDDDPEIRTNRLALLARLKSLFDQVADLSLAT